MADYPIPPWLNPQTDWGALAMRRSTLKAQINQQAQQQAQQAQQFQQQMEMKRMAMEAEQVAQEKQLQQQMEVAKHKLAIESAYNTAKIAMDAQQLEQVSRKVDLDYAQEAMKQQAIHEFESGVEERFKATGDLPKSFNETMMLKGARMPASAFSAMDQNQKQDVVPTDFVTPGGVRGVTGGGRWQAISPEMQGALETTAKPIGGGLLEVTGRGSKTSRVMKAPEFKFSKAAELKELTEDPVIRRLISGARKIEDLKSERSRADAASSLKRYDELRKLEAMELAAFNRGMVSGNPDTGSKTNRFQFDPKVGWPK